MNKRITCLIAVLFLFSGAAILTVKATEALFGNLPLVNSGSASCLPGLRGDGRWLISFFIPAGQDYVLDNIQYVWRIPAGNPATTVSTSIVLIAPDGHTGEQIADFNDVTVSNTSAQIYTLMPDRHVILEAGRQYLIHHWTDEVGGSCSLVMETSDTPPTGDFTFIDNIYHQLGIFVGFQLNGTPIKGELGIGEDLGITYPPDDRINWQCGDSHIGILYSSGDGIGLYEYSTNSYVDFLFAEDIAPYVDNPPVEPTLLAQYGLVRAYIMPTGEIQFNLGPDFEGKEYSCIISSLEDSSAYGYYFDPNE